LSNPNAGATGPHFGSLAVVGPLKANRPATPKTLAEPPKKLQFHEGAGLRARQRKAARDDCLPERQDFFNQLTFLHILARNFIIYWYTWFRDPDHGVKPGDPG
jgi:hypothetical protein